MSARAAATLLASLLLFVAAPAVGEPAGEPFVLLEIDSACATDEEDAQLVRALELRMPQAFLVRGDVPVEPPTLVAWRPRDDSTCELAFGSAHTSATMPLGPGASSEEIDLAAARIAWLASVEEPELALTAPEPAPEPPAPEPPAPEPPVEVAEPVVAEPVVAVAPVVVAQQPTRVGMKLVLWPGLVLHPRPLPPHATPSVSLGLLGVGDAAFDGVQLGGLWTAARERSRGFQGSLGVNLAHGGGDLVQLSHLNFAQETLRGGQLGLLNVGRDVAGVQVGVINIARTADFSLGLVNIMYGEPLYIDLSVGHHASVQFGFKHGSKYLRWSYLGGWDLGVPRPTWRIGLGVGLHLPLDRLFFDLDLIGMGVVAAGDPVYRVSQLLQARFNVGWQFARRFALYAGVDANALISGLLDGDQLVPEAARLVNPGDTTKVFAWPELHLGVRF